MSHIYSVSGLFLHVEFRCRCVGLPVDLLITSVYCAKTADSIEMPFGVVDRIGSGSHAVHITQGKGQIFFGGEMRRRNVTYSENAPSAVQKRQNGWSWPVGSTSSIGFPISVL